MRRDLNSLLDKLRDDSRYCRLQKLVSESPIYQIPVSALSKEMEGLHSARKVRFLSADSPHFVESLVDASLRDQAARSRLSEIVVGCNKAYQNLNTAVESITDYYLVSYVDIMSFAKTKEERKRIVDIVLRPFIKKLNAYNLLKENCEVIIKDIDKAGYVLKNSLDGYIAYKKPESHL